MRFVGILGALATLLACGFGKDVKRKAGEPEKRYDVVADESMPPFKLHVRVEIEKHVSAEVLSGVAQEIRRNYPHRCERAFINFDVLGEKPPNGIAHWAVVRWEPGRDAPDVKIYY